MKPNIVFFSIWIAIAGLTLYLAEKNLELEFALNFAIALTVATFVLYGIDKWQASRQSRRIPEKLLWLTAFFGGSIGALIGMHLFRHKTRKVSFQFILALLILVQVVVLILLSESLASWLKVG